MNLVFFHLHINLAVFGFHVVAVPCEEGSIESWLPGPGTEGFKWPLWVFGHLRDCTLVEFSHLFFSLPGGHEETAKFLILWCLEEGRWDSASLRVNASY